MLRYLADAYRALRQTVPDEAKTEELADIEEWLGELVRQVDSSLLDEWEALAAGAGTGDEVAPPSLDTGPAGVTRNVRAFRVLVRNALFRRVELAALRRWDLLGELDGEAGWDAEAWRRRWSPTSPSTPTSASAPDARGPQLLYRSPRSRSAGWSARCSTTRPATGTGRSSPRSTWPRPTRRASRSSG